MYVESGRLSLQMQLLSLDCFVRFCCDPLTKLKTNLAQSLLEISLFVINDVQLGTHTVVIEANQGAVCNSISEQACLHLKIRSSLYQVTTLLGLLRIIPCLSITVSCCYTSPLLLMMMVSLFSCCNYLTYLISQIFVSIFI